MLHRRPSPCIGICSTTYGDLVCRGCNRFAHEVVQWNTYDEAQRGVIWQRLDELRDGALASVLSACQVEALCALAASTRRQDDSCGSASARAYEALRRLAVRRLPLPWEAAAGVPSSTGTPSSAGRLLTDIDREFHHRARAAYERSYKIPAE